MTPIRHLPRPHYQSSHSLSFQGQDRHLPARTYHPMSGKPQTNPNQELDPLRKVQHSVDHSHRLGMNSIPSIHPSMSTAAHMQQFNAPSATPTPVTTSSSTSWSNHDDEILMNARSHHHGWKQIQKENFPAKTSNACRKRYERLSKRRGSDWDHKKFERLSREYFRLREQTWRPLADAIGEKWEDVEKACFEKGLRSLSSPSRPSREQPRRDILHEQIHRNDPSSNPTAPDRKSKMTIRDILED